MSTSRLFTFATAAFFAGNLSVDPGVRAVAASPRARIATREMAQVTVPALETTDVPAPSDVTIAITPEAHGAHRVVLTRRGFLVSLRNEDARAAGKDWAAMRVTPQPGGGAQGRLIWEATRLDSLETTRGVVLLAGEGEALSAELRSARAPVPAGTWKSAHASCAGQHDGLGGFTALCRFTKGTRVSGVANVTSARTLDDAWLIPGASPLARLDLPRSPGGAQGRVIGLTHGATGIVLGVEASFVEGEAPALVFHESERAQPTPLF